MSARTLPDAVAPLFPVLQIHAHDKLPGEVIARLDGATLFVDPRASPEDQLDAIADAVQVLRTGRTTRGRKVRHLTAVR